jgi:outer membrane biosynthesis protein TonB
LRARPQEEVQTTRAALRLVATRPLTAARLPFAIFIGAILAVGLVALLLLHTMAAQDAFRLQALQHQSADLDDVEEQLAVAEQQQQAPAALAARARSLGMVPTDSIAYVDLHRHGKIVGVVQAAPPPPPPPPPVSKPSPTPTASADGAKKQSAHARTKPATQSTTSKPVHKRAGNTHRHR